MGMGMYSNDSARAMAFSKAFTGVPYDSISFSIRAAKPRETPAVMSDLINAGSDAGS